ncbi:class I SAM-dependent methyltransferase [Selenomonas ruminantium]|uniref:Methyltransferase domain-containing protein n=1 Tax=Selenomonas ruminantium TaxID=971 RepID=A0A1I0Y288_SELRU|nr:class I SAM-dependent methyltransferase [Selenomonas ruminantium]SFB07479.1 Methyltransferase domain-containing protein [Selenomonas ruminantium]
MDIESTARYWSQDAENYGNIIQGELASFRVEAWQKLLREKMPADTHRVLDLGCGPAFFSIILAKMGLEVTAVDCAEGMLAQARQLIGLTGVSVDLQQMDINHLDFAASSFDVIVSRNVTWTLSHPWQVYEECQKLLRPGGRLLLFDANWNMPLYDEGMAKRAENRRQECLRQYGDTLETADEVTEPLDPLQLPLSGTKRPYWDVELLRSMGFGEVHAEFDLTERLWDEKERLLYGETPMFGVFATKF